MWVCPVRETSSIETGSVADESCEGGRRRTASGCVFGPSVVGRASASWLFFCRVRRVGRFGVDLDWKPIGTGLPLL